MDHFQDVLHVHLARAPNVDPVRLSSSDAICRRDAQHPFPGILGEGFIADAGVPPGDTSACIPAPRRRNVDDYVPVTELLI